MTTVLPNSEGNLAFTLPFIVNLKKKSVQKEDIVAQKALTDQGPPFPVSISTTDPLYISL